MAKQQKTGAEIFESAEALQSQIGKAEGFFKSNQKIVTYIGGGILALILGVIGYNFWTSSQDTDAQEALFSSTYAFEADSLKQALNGTGGNAGLLKVADDYGMTKAGNLANFMAGVALLKQGQYDKAIERLQAFSSSDLLVQARAYSLLGDAYMEKKTTEEAINYYKKAIDYKPNDHFTPTYMMKLANAYEVAKNNKEAIEVYNNLINEHPNSVEVINARKYKAKLEANE
jgi:predicted negative regulator of RcsB-dependent stress response